MRFAIVVTAATAFAVLGVGNRPSLSPVPADRVASVAAGEGRLHFDGIYRKSVAPHRLPLCLRFYPDGEVIAVVSAEPADQVALLLHRQKPRELHSTYRLQENTLTFTLGTVAGSVSYEGTVGTDGIVFVYRSLTNGVVDSAKFEFYPVSFPAE